MHHEVEVAAGQVGVGVEEPARPVGARRQPQSQRNERAVGRRRGPRPADRRRRPAGGEPVPIRRGRLEPGDVDVDGEVTLRRRLGDAPCHHLRLSGLRGHADPPFERDRTGPVGRTPGPEQHTVGEGIGAGDTVAEDDQCPQDSTRRIEYPSEA